MRIKPKKDKNTNGRIYRTIAAYELLVVIGLAISFVLNLGSLLIVFFVALFGPILAVLVYAFAVWFREKVF